MKGIVIFLLALGLLGGLVGTALAQNTAQQTVSYSIGVIDVLTISGNPGLLVIDATYTPATDATTSYSITTNGTGRRITGEINTAMPANTTLEASLAAPTGGGSSAGYLALSTTPVNLVTGIPAVAETGRTISYRFSATVAAGSLSGTRTVTLTLTN